MKCLFRRVQLLTSIVVISLSLSAHAWTTEPTPLPTAPPDTEGFLKYKASEKDREGTYQLLDKQAQGGSDMSGTAKNYESGKSRAQAMVQMLQDREMTKALQRITSKGMKTIDENPEIRSPLGVIAGAASLWYGRTVKFIKGDDFNFSARMEGRNSRSEFNMGSPLLNGRLQFDPNQGMGIGVNRSISNLQTEAALQYNARDQVFSTEVRKKLSPNLDLSFGASRLDQNTKIEYRLNF